MPQCLITGDVNMCRSIRFVVNLVTNSPQCRVEPWTVFVRQSVRYTVNISVLLTDLWIYSLSLPTICVSRIRCFSNEMHALYKSTFYVYTGTYLYAQ